MQKDDKSETPSIKQAEDKPSAYLPALTWMRGIAALLVVVSHSLRCSESLNELGFNGPHAPFFSMFDLGAYAVCVFLTLSGATLYISISNSSLPFSTAGYLLKRWLRIWPAFVFALAASWLFGFFFRSNLSPSATTAFTHQFTAATSITDALKYATMTFNFTGPSGLFNNVFWTIPVEFQYYLLLPILLTAMRRIGLIAPVLLAVAMLVMSRTGIASIMDNSKVLLLGFTFCGGVAIGALKARCKQIQKCAPGYILLAITFVCASILTHTPDVVLEDTLIPQKYISLGVLSLITVGIPLFFKLTLPNRIASLLNFFGMTSYSLYLYHNLFLGFFIIICLHAGLTTAIPTAYLAFVMTLACTIPTAFLSYKYIEKPTIILGRRLNAAYLLRAGDS